MKEQFRLVQLDNRGGALYCKDTVTDSRTSLETKNRAEAERLILHKNETLRHPLLNRRIGMAYLAGTDAAITKRTWRDVMDDFTKDKQGLTLRRWKIAIRDKAFSSLRQRLESTHISFSAICWRVSRELAAPASRALLAGARGSFFSRWP